MSNKNNINKIILKNAGYVNVFSETTETADILIENERITGIGKYSGDNEINLKGKIVVPGFIDGHIHIESSMLSPQEFEKAAMSHGTAAAVCDPHEIANVCGTAGIDYMINNSDGYFTDLYFVLPSCVPAAAGEENGAALDAASLRSYYSNPRVIGLGEVMNVPGVLCGDEDIMQKINDAVSFGKCVDGHSPGLCGADLDKYISAGVRTDHECTNINEAREKLLKGMWIMLREGTAARNLSALLPLLNENGSERCLFVTDDKHPDELLEKGHIDYSVRRAIEAGIKPERAVKTASLNAAKCFGLKNIGAIAPGYDASFFITDDIKKLHILSVWHKGKLVFDDGKADGRIADNKAPENVLNTFNCKPFDKHSFDGYPEYPCEGIEILPREILTKSCTATAENSVMLAVAERHKNTGHIGKAYLCGYGLERGAIASSIAHDSHNLIVAGTNNQDMAAAAEAVRLAGGGLAAVLDGKLLAMLKLPIGGIMSDMTAKEVCAKLDKLRKAVDSLGSFDGVDPFMTLAFISLPVIPKIRLTCGGIVHVD